MGRYGISKDCSPLETTSLRSTTHKVSGAIPNKVVREGNRSIRLKRISTAQAGLWGPSLTSQQILVKTLSPRAHQKPLGSQPHHPSSRRLKCRTPRTIMQKNANWTRTHQP